MTAIARQPATFTIKAINARGERVTSGGDQFRVDVRGSSVVRARITDLEDGTYTVKYTPSTSGSYSISITLAGASLAGSPWPLAVLMPRPESKNCRLNGDGLSNAIARETASFEVNFTDALSHPTHAEELDVSVEKLEEGDDGTDGLEMLLRTQDAATSPLPARPRENAGNTAQVPQPSTSNAQTAIPQRAILQDEEAPPRSPQRDGEPDSSSKQSKVVRRLVQGPQPLIVRMSAELDSEPIGVLLVGKLVDVVEVRKIDQKTRARVVLHEALPDADGNLVDDMQSIRSARHSSPRIDTARFSARPHADPYHVCNMLMESASVPSVSTLSRDERAKELARGSFKPLTALKDSESLQALRGAAEGQVDLMSMMLGSSRPASAGGRNSAGRKAHPSHGWVTAIQPTSNVSNANVLLAPPYMRLDAGARQHHMTLWDRRKQADSRLKAAIAKVNIDGLGRKEAEAGPSYASELEADEKHGVAFAYGSCDPGTLHAKGLVVKTHTVRYSIGLAGRYRMYVGLRQQGVSLPGSPFVVNVVPGTCHAPSTRIPPEALPLQGTVGRDGKVCSLKIQAADKMGNFCRKGGGALKVTTSRTGHTDIQIEVNDHGDGTYGVQFFSEASGIFAINVMMNNVHVLGSPTQVTMVAGPPDVAKCTLTGEGLSSAQAGLPATIVIGVKDVFGNDSTIPKDDSIVFGLALLPLRSGNTADRDNHKDHQKANSVAVSVPSIEFSSSFPDENRFEINYMAQEAGDFDLHVWCEYEGSNERKFLSGSPFGVRVSGVRASPQGSGFTVHGVEKYMEGGDSFDPIATLSDALPHDRQVEADASSPIATPEPARAHPHDPSSRASRTSRRGSNLQMTMVPRIPAGEKITIKPQLRDEFGNVSFAAEGELMSLVASEKGPPATLALRLLGGLGAYETTYDAHVKGLHNIHMTLHGDEITQSPFTFYVHPGKPTGKDSRLRQKTVPALVGMPCEMLLEAVDKFGNILDTGGASVAARALGTSVVPPTVTDNNDGTYTIAFMSSVVGVAKVMVKLENVDMPPVDVTFEESMKVTGQKPAASALPNLSEPQGLEQQSSS